MSNYTKTTDFAAKDGLESGNTGKIVRGTEFETEFDNISTAIATKADLASPTFSGTINVTSASFTDGSVTITGFLDEDDLSTNSASHLPTQQSVKAYVDTAVSGIVTEGGTQTLTSKTLTSPVINTGVSGTAVLDEDDMSSDSATQLATQQSIKAYVDTQTASAALTGITDNSTSSQITINDDDVTMSADLTTTGGDILHKNLYDVQFGLMADSAGLAGTGPHQWEFDARTNGNLRMNYAVGAPLVSTSEVVLFETDGTITSRYPDSGTTVGYNIGTHAGLEVSNGGVGGPTLKIRNNNTTLFQSNPLFETKLFESLEIEASNATLTIDDTDANNQHAKIILQGETTGEVGAGFGQAGSTYLKNTSGSTGIHARANGSLSLYAGADSLTGQVYIASDGQLVLGGGQDNEVAIGPSGGSVELLIRGLPTSDPAVANQLWNDSGTLKISAG